MPIVISCTGSIIVGFTVTMVMEGDLTVRRYKPPDAEHVWTIHELALRASPLKFVENAAADEDLTEISERYLDVGGEFLVGLIDDEIIAIGGFQPREDDTAEIRRMRIHPDYQGQGYGERLLVDLEERARERGFNRLVLETNEYLTAAQKLYAKHSYEETHRETNTVTGDEFIYYQKEILLI